MGYRSNIYLKTTTEGYLMLKKMDDSIHNPSDKPLAYSEIKRTPSGFYKITFEDLKWYESYPQVQNFNKVLDQMDRQDIPYSFIRLGEDTADIEHRRNYPDDMPYEIESFEPIVDINDEDYFCYEIITDDSASVHSASDTEDKNKD